MAKEVIFLGRDPLSIKAGDVNYLCAHARAALRAGFTPHIFCAAPRPRVVETDFGVVHQVASPFRPFRIVMLPGHEPFIAAAIERFLQSCHAPHLLHGFGVWAYSGLVVAQRLRRQGRAATIIVSSYTTLRHEARAKLLGVSADHGWLHRSHHWVEDVWTKLVTQHYERRLYGEACLVMVNYEAVERMIRAEFGDGAPIRRLPYSSATAFSSHAPTRALPPDLAALAPADAPLIVAISRHDPRKGLDVLLHALVELKAAGVRFRACMVGGDLLLEAHRRLAARLSLADTTVLVGRVPDPMAYLQHADIFVLPSLQEASGSLSLLEALQAGVAVVASDIDGIPEDVTDGDSALLVAPGNVAALAGALARVINDAPLRAHLRRRARETFETRFSAAAFTQALGQFYAELGFTAAPEKY